MSYDNLDGVYLATPHFKGAFDSSFHKLMGGTVNLPVFPESTIGNFIPAKKIKLIIFTGGEDINPSLYRESNTYSYTPNSHRDEVESQIFNYYYKKVFMLGVCRGFQLINCLLGGSLIQDLNKNNTPHSSGHRLIYIAESKILKHPLGDVNSLHHQGLNRIGKSLIVTSIFNGIPESFEDTNLKILGVQYHPEFMESVKFFDDVMCWIGEKQKPVTFDTSTYSLDSF